MCGNLINAGVRLGLSFGDRRPHCGEVHGLYRRDVGLWRLHRRHHGCGAFLCRRGRLVLNRGNGGVGSRWKSDNMWLLVGWRGESGAPVWRLTAAERRRQVRGGGLRYALHRALCRAIPRSGVTFSHPGVVCPDVRRGRLDSKRGPVVSPLPHRGLCVVAAPIFPQGDHNASRQPGPQSGTYTAQDSTARS